MRGARPPKASPVRPTRTPPLQKRLARQQIEIDLMVAPQPTDTSCGPTCLEAIIDTGGDPLPIGELSCRRFGELFCAAVVGFVPPRSMMAAPSPSPSDSMPQARVAGRASTPTNLRVLRFRGNPWVDLRLETMRHQLAAPHYLHPARANAIPPAKGLPALSRKQGANGRFRTHQSANRRLLDRHSPILPASTPLFLYRTMGNPKNK